MGHRCLGVVIERVGSQEKVLVLQLYVVGKESLFGVCVIFAPVGSKHTAVINQFTTFKEVAKTVHAVIVEAVGIKRCLTVLQHDVVTCTGQFSVTVIVGIVAEERQGVALIHLDMAKSLKGVAGLKEVGTVTIKPGTHVSKMNFAPQHLRIAVLVLVVTQLIGMNQIDSLVLRLGLTNSPCSACLLLFLGDRRHGFNNTQPT